MCRLSSCPTEVSPNTGMHPVFTLPPIATKQTGAKAAVAAAVAGYFPFTHTQPQPLEDAAQRAVTVMSMQSAAASSAEEACSAAAIASLEARRKEKIKTCRYGLPVATITNSARI